MNDEAFIDTNVLVYAFDDSEPVKREKAKKLIKEVSSGKRKAAVSNQVLGELFTVLTSKIDSPLEKKTAQAIVRGFIDSVHWRKINYTDKTVDKAMGTSISGKMHFWDSLITETMLENRVYKILTENTKHFKTEHTKTTNPFTAQHAE